MDSSNAMSWLNKLLQKSGSSPKAKLSLQSKAKHVDLNLPPPSMEPISNFTPRAEQSLKLARTEASQLSHNFVGTEHLLLGLIALGEGVAFNVLTKRGMNLDIVRKEVAKLVSPSPSNKIVGNVPITPQFKKVMVQACAESDALRHTYIGTEHLLMALLAEKEGAILLVFKRFALEPRTLREAILAERDPNYRPATALSAKTATTTPTPSKSSQPTKLSLPAAQAPAPASQPVKATAPAPAAPQATKPIPPPPAPPPPSTPKPRSTTAPASNGSVDLAKRYDIYCMEANQSVTVHRNARFKAVKQLLPGSQNDPMSAFFELEVEDGRTVFVPRSSVIRFEEQTADAVK